MKNKFIKIFLLDLAYFISFIILIFFLRTQVRNLLAKIQSYGLQLNIINPQENIVEAQELLQSLSSLSLNTYLFVIILAPLSIFLIYIIFQGFSYYFLKKEKHYYSRFILVSLIAYAFFILLIFKYHLILLILAILVSYFAFLFYFKNFKDYKLAFTKIYKILPLYLLYIILAFLIIASFFVSYLSLLAQANFGYIFLGIILTLIFSYYKINLVKWI
ncbi:MAG: hypothetical protein AABX55_01210 [Nanoarchaeota archaeon]